MTSVPETRNSLLIRLANPADHEAWYEFTEIYRPIVYRRARLQGLQDADAQDLAQRVLISVCGAISEWEQNPKRAKFRTWLHTVARNALIDHLRAVRPYAAVGGTTALEQLHQQSDETTEGEEIDHETQRELFRWAALKIRPEFTEDTWLAFWRTTVENQEVPTVAAQLKKSVGAIYIARSRVMQRLRDKVQEYRDDLKPFVLSTRDLP